MISSLLRRCAALTVAIALGFAVRPCAAATVYDLTTDWSDAANPNGAWSYLQGSTLLPHVAAWQGLSGDFTSAQPAWARVATGDHNLPSIFRSVATVGIVHDWQTGDVLAHTTDNFNGIGAGPARIAWTSPITGTVAVTGHVWMGRDIGRSNHWSLFLGSTLLSGGDIASGDAYDRAHPFDFANGSGGAAALSALSVHAGDAIVLQLDRTSTAGDYVGMVFTVTLVSPAAAPPPAVPAHAWLAAPAPDPAWGPVRIRFGLAQSGPVTLEVFDITGRRAATLVRDARAVGEYDVMWDGRDASGSALPSGVYRIRLSSANVRVERRIVRLGSR